MATAPSPAGGEKKYWWLTSKMIVDKYVKEARGLISSKKQREIAFALHLLDAALLISPRFELALELKARSLLNLRRFRDVADMLQAYIPSLKMASNDDSLPLSSSDCLSPQQFSKERVMLLPSRNSSVDSPEGDIHLASLKCFPVSEVTKKVMAGLRKNCNVEGQWRYLVLGEACCHLGLMEDAILLLQTGKRLATAAFRRQSITLSDDSFPFSKLPITGEIVPIANKPLNPPTTQTETISELLSNSKLLLRRKTSAIAAMDAGQYSEAIRHFSKIVDSRRGTPQGFLAECYMYRASAYRFAGRIAESIADCNRALALDATCIEALSTRAANFESIRCLTDSLHDLEHLKLLYNTILRDRRLPGPAWKRQNVRYREIPGKLCSLTVKIQELKKRVASGESGNVDYYALMGLRRGCSLSELERAHLLLTLRHKADKSLSFMDRCEFADEREMNSIREKAKMSALSLCRLTQKGFTSLASAIKEEEAVEKHRKNSAAAVALQAQAAAAVQVQQIQHNHSSSIDNKSTTSTSASMFQGVFCRDIAAVGNLLSQTGFNRPMPVKFEALSC